MRNSEIRYYLHNLEWLRDHIEQLQQDIETFKSMDILKIKITSELHDTPRSNTNVITRTVETIAIDRVQQIERMENELAHYIIILRCIDNVLAGLKGHIRQIINMRYLDKLQGHRGPTFDEIANELGYKVNKVFEYDRMVINNIIRRYNNIIGQ